MGWRHGWQPSSGSSALTRAPVATTWTLRDDLELAESRARRGFDRIDHTALMDRVRGRIKDKRVLRLIKAFLKAGVLSQHGGLARSVTGTPQGGSSRRCWPTSPSASWTRIY